MDDSNGLSILLRAKLDATQDTLNNINKEIENLSKNPALQKIKLKIDVDESELLNINKRIQEIQTTLTRGFGNISSASTSKVLPQLDPNDIEDRVKRITNALDRLKVGKDKVFADARVNTEVIKLDDMIAQFKRGEISSKDLSLQMDNLRTRAYQVSNEFKNVSKDGYGFGEMMSLAAKKLLIWKFAGDAVFSVLNLLKQIPDVVSKIDKSLTEINKVLDLSTSQMRTLAEEATKMGIAYGKSTVEVLDSIGAFAKAGMDKNVSKQFAELAMLLSNVGDISAESAQKTLIMANAGYQLGNDYKALNTLISQFNELANRNAVEVDTLSEAWQNSASMAYQAKLSIADYNALITVAGTNSQKSGKEVGNALKTWFMRLQGVTDGVDTLEEDVSKVDKVLGDLGIQLKKSPTEFRPTMTVISEIADKYRELGKAGQTVKQSELLETLAGKYRANIVSGVLQNFDQVNKAIQDQTNSFQSAEKENARYMDSIQAKTKALSAQWELFASNTLDSNIIKSIVDFSRVLIQILDSDFTRFAATTALVTTAAWGASAAFTALKSSTLGTAVGVAALELSEKGLLATTKTLWATMSASPLFWVAAATAAVYGVVKLFDALNVTIEEQKEKVEEAKQAYEDTKSEIQTLNTELETTAKRIDELNSKDKLTIVEEDELAKLQLSNKELQLRQALLETEEQNRQKRLGEEQLELYNKQYGKYSYSDNQVQDYINEAKLTGNNAGLMAEANDIAALSAAYTQFSELKQKALESGDTSNLEHFDGLLTEIQESLSNSAKELYEAKDILSALKNPTDAEKQALVGIETRLNAINKIVIPEKFESITDGIKESSNSLTEYNSILSKLSSKLQETDAEGKKNNDSLSASFNRIEESVSDVNNAIDKLKKGEELTADEIASLIVKHNELAGNLVEVNGVYTLRLDVLEKVRNSELDTQIAAFKAANAIKENEWQVIKDRLAQYGIFYEKLSDMSSKSLTEDINKKISEQASKGNISNIIGLSKLRDETAPLGQYLDTLNDLDLLKDNLTGKRKSTGTKSTKSPIPYQDISSELLTTYNTQVEIDKLESKRLEKQIKTAESAKDYNSAIELQNKLLQNQQKTVDDLEKSNDKIHQSAEKMRSDNSQYNTLGWFDQFGNSTVEYLNLVKSFEGKTDEASKRQLSNIQKLFSDLQKLKQGWMENTDAIDLMNDSIGQTKQNIAGLYNDRYNAIRTQVSDYKHGLEDLMTAEEERHKNALDNIEDEKKSFDDRIDKQIEDIDRLRDKENYDSDVTDITTEITKLQKQKNELAMAAASGDSEAISLISDIDEKLADKQKDLDKKQQDRKYDLRKQNLQDIKKSYDEDAEAKKDSENDKYNTIKSNYEKLTNDISTFTDTSISLNTTMVDNMITDYTNLSNSFTGNVQEMAKVFQEQFINKLQNARQEISNLNAATGGGKSTSPSSPTQSSSGSKGLKDHRTLGEGFEKMSNSEFQTYVQNKRKWDLGTISEAELEYNRKLRKQYGIKSDRYFYRDLKDYFDDGGIASGIGFMPKNTLEPERVLSPRLTVSFEKLVDMLPNLADAFKLNAPKLNYPKLAGTGFNMGNIVINVNGSITDSNIKRVNDNITGQLKNVFTQAGIVSR